jgi:hypothetical protein
VARADIGGPMMDPERPVQCAKDSEGHIWRLQCSESGKKVCLYAPNQELDSDGVWVKPLERARECAFEVPFDRPKLEHDGFTMVPGRADAPWGWTRDERGRVFQVNFDLTRRMYFGAAYSPQKVVENPLDSQRTSIDFGLLVVDILNKGTEPTRHRLRFFEGEVHLQPFSAELVMAHYDVSRRYTDPLLRITTFVGEPSRHDLHLNVGMWTEVGGLELHRTSLGNSQLWRHGTAEVTLDLWQSQNLDSYARVRTGLGLEGQHDEVNGYRSALTAASAFEINWVLDQGGFHNLRLELDHEMPRYFTPLAGESKYSQRLKAKLMYETILVAINDQPLTFKLAAGGDKRNDLPGVPDQWAFVVDAGLRFNLWAPPRPR